MDTKVRIAGPSHILNPVDHGYVIYAEWHCKGDSGEMVTMTEALDYAETQGEAVDTQARWTDALS